MNNITEGDDHVLHWMIQGLFGMFLSTLILVAEKLLIQIIASNFHRRSYEDRIREQKQAIRALVTLYMNSHDIGRSDTLDRGYLAGGRGADPARVLRKALKGVKQVAKSTTTVFGTVASEIAGERILQPNSPASMVLSALSSANKTRQLARRIYYSFVPTHYRTMMVLSDIGKFFDNEDQSREAFEIFDKDENGDASLEDIELACLDSMRDLDSAVGRLDSILMFIWYFISLLIIIALLDVSFQTMLASAGTLTLGLSWLIGATAQEVLSSVVFLFIKHPYDIGDRVDVDDITYVVKEMHLLYTIRRSGAISESFTWDVDFNTSFDMIEALREKMLAFLRTERREFVPSIDISVEDFEGQAKMTLQADIKYKSNWQNTGLKTQRRNKWVCALKQIMAELEMWGPDGSGNPDPPPSPTLIRLLEGPPPLPPADKTESPSRRTPVRSVQFGESSLATDLWLDEPLDTSPPLPPHPPPAHVPIDINRGPSQLGTDIEMQFQRRN
ncbi:uncharacterized protein MELLADRAFT_65659 [Melampsora larici-populina 98AG31]|uniref:EF-hand domain-containing protein n=1 Tax=Melampsora larici-populina (strain 98AG31 / pathotype 3-4-7) TaxID=747676 RepID=F4RW90_MELLP|nr:uncharacterized protein MELLADRAFT_65659 [Melampsora larici-populina 98AG31]EGG03241.1 hypothetical protein MELLADRAFT_65659 [Melampsora larici-populina 98AG31]